MLVMLKTVYWLFPHFTLFWIFDNWILCVIWMAAELVIFMRFFLGPPQSRGKPSRAGRQVMEEPNQPTEDNHITVSGNNTRGYSTAPKKASLYPIYCLPLLWVDKCPVWNWHHYEWRGLWGVRCPAAGDHSASAGKHRDSRLYCILL